MRHRRRKSKRDLTEDGCQRDCRGAHLRELGFRTEQGYADWCERHGISTQRNKTTRQRAAEVELRRRQRAELALRQARQERRGAASSIDAIFSGQLDKRQLRDPALRGIHDSYRRLRRDRCAVRALHEITNVLTPRSPLLQTGSVFKRLGVGQANTYPHALEMLARNYRRRIRPIEQWRPRSHNPLRQFRSLARHLFVQYDMPNFMDIAWFMGADSPCQQWYLHLGRGENIRTAQTPIPLTKRMAHAFLQAPDDYTPDEALQWAQIQAEGGDERIAKALRETVMFTDFQHQEFWLSVVRFLVASPMLDTAQFGPIIDYLDNQRHRPVPRFVQRGVRIEDPPRQPNLSMKGRTVGTLLRQVQAWHRQLNARSYSEFMQWTKAPFAGLEFEEGQPHSRSWKRWVIYELLDSNELQTEGKKMRHCVASYALSCRSRATSIWAMEQTTQEGHRKLLTVEVRLANRRICQARGKFNARPSESELRVLQRWASQAGLSLASYV